ncbi:hippurate hydrolase [Sphingomonas jejuensis]|uniref:Hippurate hydrolase n=1 Tax=Sphingomonas jejuensis TaxID=904715 RepID=A0ABX0XMK1_9SPHN|nr:amidohydrolase [Sphingomonas jejuensis]NJC34603.1 hippurate hydrolase [Sphingomonas jejuensis]
MRHLLLFALLASAAAPVAAQADNLRADVARDLPSLIEIYRDLHAHPELSFQETRSAGVMAREARAAGFTVTEGVGRTGVVAVLENGPGPVILLRADMDALPVTEQTGLPYASTVKVTQEGGGETGVMHACGHDTHMTAWIGTARRMAAMRDQWRGTLVMVGQPAEEIGSGARAMLEDGLYTRFPKPRTAIAFHDAAALPAGQIGVRTGYVMANVDPVDILVRGVGGHGAYPHLAKDPIVLASRIVNSLQTLVSREIDPLESGVVTVGSFHGGTKHNIIGDEARLQLTVRSYTPAVRQHLLDGIARIARGEAIAAGIPEDRMPVVTTQDEFTPAVYNSDALTTETIALFQSRFGADRVTATRAQMGGEDFSRFRLADTDGVEAVLFWVGGVPQAKWDEAGGDLSKLPSIHSPFWAPDPEPTIAAATEAITAAAIAAFNRDGPARTENAAE